MGVGAMVFGGGLLPRSVEVPIWSPFEVGGDSCVALVEQGRLSRGLWCVPSSGDSRPASAASSPPSPLTTPLPPGIKVAQAATLIGSWCDQGYGVKEGSSCNIRISRSCFCIAPLCRKISSPAVTLSYAVLELRGMMQVHEFAHERRGPAPSSHFFTRSDAVTSMWWKSWMRGCGAASYHHVLCFATMVVAGNSVVSVWEDHIAAFEANSQIIQIQLLHIRVPHGYAQCHSNVSLDGWKRTGCASPTSLVVASLCLPISTSTSSSSELYCYLSGCGTSYSLQTAVHDEYVFLLFGIRRRWVRAFLLRILRFNGQEPPDLSSVMVQLNLQLNPLPHRHIPTRLLVEPLALRLVRLQEALEEYEYRCFESEFSTDHPGKL